MNDQQDIRWVQRFNNFSKAFKQLERFVDQNELNELEEQGLIKSFEYTYELAWKTLQDLLKDKGYRDINGPRPVIEQCFQDGYIQNGEGWMKMHTSRNLTTHTYNQDAAREIVEMIRMDFYYLFLSLFKRLEEERYGIQNFLFDE